MFCVVGLIPGQSQPIKPIIGIQRLSDTSPIESLIYPQYQFHERNPNAMVFVVVGLVVAVD